MGAAGIGAAAGGALGLIQNNQKVADYNRQKQLAADVERNSPWTHQSGMDMMPKDKPNALNGLLSGVTSGMMMGQSMGGAGGAGAAGAGGGVPTLSGMQGGASPWSGMGMATQQPGSQFGQQQYKMGSFGGMGNYGG